MASSIPISKWPAAFRKPDHPPAASDLTGMMYEKDSTTVLLAQHGLAARCMCELVLGRVKMTQRLTALK
jgi:hypothetical protein